MSTTKKGRVKGSNGNLHVGADADLFKSTKKKKRAVDAAKPKVVPAKHSKKKSVDNAEKAAPKAVADDVSPPPSSTTRPAKKSKSDEARQKFTEPESSDDTDDTVATSTPSVLAPLIANVSSTHQALSFALDDLDREDTAWNASYEQASTEFDQADELAAMSNSDLSLPEVHQNYLEKMKTLGDAMQYTSYEAAFERVRSAKHEYITSVGALEHAGGVNRFSSEVLVRAQEAEKRILQLKEVRCKCIIDQ